MEGEIYKEFIEDVNGNAITKENLSITAIKNKFSQNIIWTQEPRKGPFILSPAAPKPAAVLVALIERDNGVNIILTQRTAHLSNHAGQIAFAGGRIDDFDKSPAQAAIREANEEIGLNSHDVEIIGHFPDYLVITNYKIIPVIAIINNNFTPIINTDEVDDIFEVPLDFLMNPNNYKKHTAIKQGREVDWFSTRYIYNNKERYIWGATAGIIRNFYRFMAA